MKRIYIGTSGWSYKDWAGNFYPPELKSTDYLEYYSRHFNSVEIDSTFYGVPRKTTVANWYKSVPPEFKFAAKFPKEITHDSGLTGVEDLLNKYLDTMSGLKEKLGPLLIQFPYSFKPDMSDELASFLNLLPKGFGFVIEIRNRKWLDERFYQMLREHSVGLALLDHPWMPRVDVATSRALYVRFLGDRQEIPDDFTHERIERSQDLEQWARIISALEEKVDDFYGYFNNHYSGHSPTTAGKFLSLLNRNNQQKAIQRE
jgi:uncharacterized protein YecE (DUF72 family)